MKILKCMSTAALAASLCFAQSAHAVTISPAQFLRLGGSLLKPLQTIAGVFGTLQQQSNQPQFMSVGTLAIGKLNCTATWLGDSPDDPLMYVLTAAHCVDGNAGANTVATDIPNATFTDWQGKTIGRGRTSFQVPMGRPAARADAAAAAASGGGGGKLSAAGDAASGAADAGLPAVGALTDMAVLVMPKIDSITDITGTPIAAPMLYMGQALLQQPASFVGTGVPSVAALPLAPSVFNLFSRTLGQSMLQQQSNAAGLMLPFDLFSTTNWARSSPGDDGAAIWQQTDQGWAVVGMVTGMLSNGTAGMPLTAQLDWLKSMLPDTAKVIDTANGAAPSTTPVSNLAPAADALQSSPLLSPFSAPLSSH